MILPFVHRLCFLVAVYVRVRHVSCSCTLSLHCYIFMATVEDLSSISLSGHPAAQGQASGSQIVGTHGLWWYLMDRVPSELC